MAKTETGAKQPEKDPSLLSSKCIVQFRPHSKYDGQYGFDWMRMGDTGLQGDTWYAKIIGRYNGRTFAASTGEYTKLTKEYGSMTVGWKRDSGKADWLYLVPILTIWKGDSINLTLKVEVEEEPKILKINYDPTIFEVSPDTISKKSKGKRELSNFLTIKCLKDFKTNKSIEVISVDDTGIEKCAGKLTVMANSSKETKKILFVKVVTVHNGLKEEVTGSEIEVCKKTLSKYLKQPYISPVYAQTTEINLTQTQTNLDGTPNIVLRSDFRNKYVNINGLINDEEIEGLFDYLQPKLTDKDKYNDYYKVYLINRECITNDGMWNTNGLAENIPSKQVVIFKTGLNGETMTHELLHAMGLYHTFDNDGKFTFEKEKTENIMDYKNFKRISTWKWQWKVLNKKL